MSRNSRGVRILERLGGLVMGRCRWRNFLQYSVLPVTESGRRMGRRGKRAAAVCPLELLEPRILLASDFVFEATAKSAQSSDWILLRTATDIELHDALTGSLIKSQPIAENTGLARIYGRGQDDTLRIDASLPTSLRVHFRGRGGQDRLLGPTIDSTWSISGSNAGTLNGHVVFIGVEELIGAADNEDTFVFGRRGRLSGGLDGGEGGFDTLVFDGGTFASVTYAATGPDSGTVTRNSDVIRYAGLEPINDNMNTVDRRITLTDANNLATLFEDAAGMLTLSDDDGIPGTFESITFAKPSGSLTIDMAEVSSGGLTDDGDDQITIHSINLGAADLKILAEKIIVTPGAVLNTSGDLTLLAKKTGIKQLEDFGPLNFNSKFASILVGSGAQISADNLIIRSEALDKAFTTLLGTKELPNELLIDPLINKISGLFDLPFKVLFKASDASVTISSDAALTATGKISIEADAIADANGGGAADTATSVRFPVKATSSLFSVGYVQTTARAVIDIQTGVAITAGDAVAINSDGTATALLKTKTDRELGAFPNDPLGIGFSLAITRTDITSTTTVATGATITAGKTVNITAEGLEDSEAEAEVGIYNDGRAGLAFGLSFSHAVIDTDVNGVVTAEMNPGSVVKLEFDPTVTDPNAMGFVDAANNTIRVGSHSLSTGDKVQYSNRRGTSIAGPLPIGFEGLTDGDVAFVITTDDPTKIKLAESRDKAIAGNEIALSNGRSFSVAFRSAKVHKTQLSQSERRLLLTDRRLAAALPSIARRLPARPSIPTRIR